MRDQDYYSIVADEIISGNFDEGLWTRAFADALGDERKAVAFYIKLRVKQLKINDYEKMKKEKKITKEKSDSKAPTPVFILLLIIGIFFFLLSFIILNNRL